MTGPDHRQLFDVASEQGGYFTARQAHGAGFSRWAIIHHVRRGRFQRIRRGLFRLDQYPSSPDEHIIAAWLAAGPAAVVSHETALHLHGLSDVIPQAVHVTVPRSHRRVAGRLPEGIAVHTTTKSVPAGQVVRRGVLRVTSPARSIVDAAEAGTAPEQIVRAVHQAIEQGLLTRRQLLALARERPRRVAALIARALEGAV